MPGWDYGSHSIKNKTASLLSNARFVNKKRENWQRPTLPRGYPPSTIGANSLNDWVRYVSRCTTVAPITNLSLYLNNFFNCQNITNNFLLLLSFTPEKELSSLHYTRSLRPLVQLSSRHYCPSTRCLSSR